LRHFSSSREREKNNAVAVSSLRRINDNHRLFASRAEAALTTTIFDDVRFRRLGRQSIDPKIYYASAQNPISIGIGKKRSVFKTYFSNLRRMYTDRQSVTT
jgi:hypothetical protein